MNLAPTSELETLAEITDEAVARGQSVADVWGGAVTPASGFVALPMALLRLQSKLELSATDMVVLANLLAHRWKAGDAVFPRTTTIAKRMGVDPRTVQRSADRMIKAGLMERKYNREGMRAYDFGKLNELLAREVESSLLIKRGESLDA